MPPVTTGESLLAVRYIGYVLAWFLLFLLTGSAVYCVLTILAALRYRAVRPPQLRQAPPISVLERLAGIDDGLGAEPSAPSSRKIIQRFEILFAVRSPEDPAVALVERLCARTSGHSHAALILTGEPPYPNAKVFSLDRMLAAATPRPDRHGR